MPWPGTPKSQQSPTINPPSMRYPHSLNEHSTMAEVADAVKTAFDGLTVHEQAFANLPKQIATQAATAATNAVTSSSSSAGSSTSGGSSATAKVQTFNSIGGNVIFFPSLGQVNDQLGNPAYYTQNSDSGKKIIVGTDSTVNVVFNSSVPAPWFTIIDNDSSGIVYLFADSGAVYGAQIIPDSGFGIVFFDGFNFWAGATPQVTGGGGSGVTSLQGETGAITLTSSGATVAITTPTSTTINLESTASGTNNTGTAPTLTLHGAAGAGATYVVGGNSYYGTIQITAGTGATIGFIATVNLAVGAGFTATCDAILQGFIDSTAVAVSFAEYPQDGTHWQLDAGFAMTAGVVYTIKYVCYGH